MAVYCENRRKDFMVWAKCEVFCVATRCVPLGMLICRWRDNVEMGVQEVGWWVWSGLIWLRIGTGGGLL